MGKSKLRTVSTIVTMTVLGFMIIFLYFYLSTRVKPTEITTIEDMTEAEKLLGKDFELYYPDTPREVVKLYSRFMKTLYTDINEDETKQLALKIRELYDEELLIANPEEDYLNNLYSEIIAGKENGQRITNYIIVKKEDEKRKTAEGMEYATIYASFSIQAGSKYSLTQMFLLRKNVEGDWKILGWEPVTEEE